MTLLIKNHRPPTYYGVNTKPLPASWDSHTMWRCSRHIPSSKVYPAFVGACPSCKQPRPPEDRRPADPYAPPVKVVPSLPTGGADYLKDPEWVQGAAVVETPAPSNECPRCGDDPLLSTVCSADFLELPPAVVTEESLENMRTLREVNAELNFGKDMSLGQAQREFDAQVIGDLTATAEALAETTGCEMPTELTQEFPEPVVMDSIHTEPSPKAKKAVCPGHGCRKYARESSPYCSKICSDRCGRVRRKAASGAVLTKPEKDNLARIERALENWGSR